MAGFTSSRSYYVVRREVVSKADADKRHTGHPVLVPPPTKGARRRALRRKLFIVLQILFVVAIVAGLLVFI